MAAFLLIALIVLAGAVLASRAVDIRLVLGAAAFLLFVVAGDVAPFFVTFAGEMANPRTVVPICSAMGFAYVVRATGCERHLVHLLVMPLRRVRSLLVPGGVAVGWTVNTAIVSQSSTAATVGPVLVPVVTAAGIPLATAGAMLLLGSSAGGELVNPGAVEVVTLSTLTGAAPTATVARLLGANLIASITAVAVFWFLAVRRPPAPPERSVETDAEPADDEPADGEPFRANPFKALVPLVPLAILFALPALVTLPESLSTSIMIGAAMLAGVALAAVAVPSKAATLATPFFEGAGFAYARVISLIVTATLFTEAIKANGIIEAMSATVASRPAVMTVAAVCLPLLLAAVSGSGIAPAVAVMKVLVPIAAAAEMDATRVGVLCAVSAQLGRTMSPAAAVVMMSSAVSGVQPHELLRRVVVPLLSGALALLVAGLLGLV